MTLIPAYGRDYKSAKAVKADFDANKDFVTSSIDSGYGQYINKEQIPAGSRITIRYNSQRSVVGITV